MKAKYLILFFSVFALSSTAQSWCPAGAVWHYQVRGFAVDGLLEYRYVSDTLLKNMSCKKITGTFSGTISSSANAFTVIPNYRNYYSYESNSVIYLYNGATFDTVVDFSASIGDRWLGLPSDSIPSPCNSRRALTVTDTGHVVINGHWLKTISTTYTSSVTFGMTTYTLERSNIFIERVQNYSGGTSNNDMFPVYCERDNTVIEFHVYFFQCYQDDSFPVYNLGKYGCNSLTSLNPENKQSEIAVYPNPSTDVIFISNQGIDRLSLNCRITNLIGREVSCMTIESPVYPVRLDISGLTPGVYLLEIYEAGTVKTIHKIIKE